MKDTQLRIGIIGINGRGRLSRYWHDPDGKSIVAAAADISQYNLDQFRQYGNADAFCTLDYHELLARDDIDAVAVTTPDKFHEEHAIAALQAGKPVYCDKPMAITIDGCDRMLAAARDAHRKLMIGFNMRYMTFVRKMKELVESGEIGQIKAVWIRHFVGMGTLYYFHGWHALRANCTSLLLQKGCHDIDVMHFVTGRYTRRVAAFGGLDYFGGDKPNDLKCENCELTATCPDDVHDLMSAKKPDRQYCAFRKEVDIPDNYVTIMELDGGIKATYNECHFTPDYHRNYVFIGTKGRIENNELENKIWIWRRRDGQNRQPDVTIDLGELDKNRLEEVGHGGSDAGICADFVDMVLEDRDPPVPALAGRMSVAVGCMAQKSLDNGGAPYDIPAIG